MYALILTNTEIIAVSDNAEDLLKYRDSLSYAEKMQYTVAEKKDGYWLKITRFNGE